MVPANTEINIGLPCCERFRALRYINCRSECVLDDEVPPWLITNRVLALAFFQNTEVNFIIRCRVLAISKKGFVIASVARQSHCGKETLRLQMRFFYMIQRLLRRPSSQ